MLTMDNAALDLLAEVDAELQEQADEETTNVFVSVKELREFTKTIDELQVVFLTVIMCVLAVKRLANNRGTRLTLVDGFMQPHLKAYGRKLERMDQSRKDARGYVGSDYKDRLQAKMEERDDGRARRYVATVRPAMAAVRYVHTSTGGNQDGAATGSEVPRTGEAEDSHSAHRRGGDCDDVVVVGRL
ncbi:hypothetical protein PR003_g10020 [Phytophthora rubi]|uniref:Uncharacterized protein n=1 Tax=Phytophthora rubi TaxID=129364 RepID=A0A6A4F6S3_9STRA|nr:hypothetical protein PR003_g10020 [Phytophthora rubi]